MAVRRVLRWAHRDFRNGLSALDPSKLMIAPILFVAILALLDRAVYEIDQAHFQKAPERMTRL